MTTTGVPASGTSVAHPPQPEALLTHLDFVRRLARSLLAEQADDVAQETWLASLRRPSRAPGTTGTGSRSTARNAARVLRERRCAERSPSTSSRATRRARTTLKVIDVAPGENRELTLRLPAK